MSAREPRDPLAEVEDPFAAELRTMALTERHRPVESWSPSPTRAAVSRRHWGALVAALLVDSALLLAMGVRPDLGAVSHPALGLAIGAPLAGAVIALRASSARGGLGVGTSPSWVLGSLLLALGAFALSALPHAHMVQEPGAHFVDATAACIMGTALLTVGPLTLGVAAFRRAFASSALLRTAALGAASGAFAAAAMALRCGIDGRAHVWIGHGTFIVAGAGIGAVLSRWTRA